jgi:hypothetical protein
LTAEGGCFTVAPASPAQKICVLVNRPITTYLRPEEVRSASVRLLHTHWSALCRGDSLPSKRAIDPAAIVPCLPYLTLAEIHRDPLRLRFRLVGTEIVQLRDGEFTWRWLEELGWDAALVATLLARTADLIERRTPLFGLGDVVWHDGRRQVYEWAMLPLSEDGTAVTHSLMMDDFRFAE